ncbi:VRR-NUC domain-containing protein [Chitinimonas prasina]|nr:VRR-NUC domain-containing protein [Chitinimonas prasina]
MQRPTLAPLYYLTNFQSALGWISERYGDLLGDPEQAFIAAFQQLPLPSQALLVRLVMRKGPLFLASKLHYPEIGCIRSAAAPLTSLGWLDTKPELSLPQLFQLLTRADLAQALPAGPAGQRKDAWLAELSPQYPEPRPLAAWHPTTSDTVYALQVTPICERLRLMFFGNLHQDWSEFVLTDLGVFQYEKVPFSPHSRAFQHRQEIDDYLHLHDCRQRLHQGTAITELLDAIPSQPYGNPWLESRRARLLFQLAQQCEADDVATALAIYQRSSHPGARTRQVRLLELQQQYATAFALATAAQQQPENDAELQQLARILPRLARRLGQPKPAPAPAVPVPEQWLVLPPSESGQAVELAVRDHLHRIDAPVHYVENTLLNGLFGLLFWPALYAPLPGAFFHPFQAAPADLYRPDFQHRRAAICAQCFAELDSGSYRETLRQRYQEKAGLQCPFIHWPWLTPDLLEQALAAIPPQHLKLLFQRMLADLQANRTGLPDLIQFQAGHPGYRMIEVKGPGDKLQDNQKRWLTYCLAHSLPISVCYVRWQAGSEAGAP